MPPRKIPGTGEIYWSNPHTGDRIIDLTNYPELDNSQKQEDVLIIGGFDDFSGSGGKPAQEVMLQGLADFEADPLARSEGARDHRRTDRGNIASNKRQRPKIVYVEN